MKRIVDIVRWTVGLLFIFSGLIKANDPLGLSYKMQEFFEVWQIHVFDQYTLLLSIAMNLFEIVAGIALIVGFKPKLTLRCLLLLILFFTFLTGYALFSGKIKTCGCFGDCLPLTPLQSFIKDVMLLLIIIFLLIFHKKILPLFSIKYNIIIIAISKISVIALQWYVLQYLPLIDCLPYHKGANIVEQMKVPAEAVTDSFAITFQYQKNGNIVEFSATDFPDDFDSSYQFIKRYDKLIRKGNATPKITDLQFQTLDGVDVTQSLLQSEQPINFVFFTNWPNTTNQAHQMLLWMQELSSTDLPLYWVTSNVAAIPPSIIADSNFHFLKCDATVVKTIARVNPTLYCIQKGIILEKMSGQKMKQFVQQVKKP